MRVSSLTLSDEQITNLRLGKRVPITLHNPARSYTLRRMHDYVYVDEVAAYAAAPPEHQRDIRQAVNTARLAFGHP